MAGASRVLGGSVPRGRAHELEAGGAAVAVQGEDGEGGCAFVRSQARPCLTLARLRVSALPWHCSVVQVPATVRKGRQGILAAGACGLGFDRAYCLHHRHDKGMDLGSPGQAVLPSGWLVLLFFLDLI